MLEDRFGRTFPYLRLSVTDACNFRCTYCLPDGYRKTQEESFLSLDEIRRLAAGFASLGTRKIRLTGGEPATRRDLPEIAASIAALPGVQTLALTTNGYNLKQNARRYFEAGINALNVSVDSLDPVTFHAVTGHDKLSLVLEGIDAARAAGFRNIKINSVLLKDVTDRTLPDFLEWMRAEALSVRFIELMQTGSNREFFAKHFISAEVLKAQLLERGFAPAPRAPDAGPAQEFHHPDYPGKIGMIAPYSKDFCKTCNRLRVTARGRLMLCLFGAGGYELRPFLQSDDQRDELRQAIAEALHFKHETHYLHQGVTGSTPHLASLGG
ncbi:MAG: GTP 3',8-cyclase MoaA [Alphaproteobacteria bacterium]|nr:GTP 3',8-cyclase MoaA [Alphaproteobacteria bacterium]